MAVAARTVVLVILTLLSLCSAFLAVAFGVVGGAPIGDAQRWKFSWLSIVILAKGCLETLCVPTAAFSASIKSSNIFGFMVFLLVLVSLLDIVLGLLFLIPEFARDISKWGPTSDQRNLTSDLLARYGSRVGQMPGDLERYVGWMFLFAGWLPLFMFLVFAIWYRSGYRKYRSMQDKFGSGVPGAFGTSQIENVSAGVHVLPTESFKQHPYFADPDNGVWQQNSAASPPAGIGLYFVLNIDGYQRVSGFVDGGAAATSGAVFIGDAVKTINGKSAHGWMHRDMKNAILGPVGTPVRLELQRETGRVVTVVLNRSLTPAQLRRIKMIKANNFSSMSPQPSRWMEGDIGIELFPDSLGNFCVERIHPHSPAALCQLINVGDLLTNIDNEILAGKSMREVRTMLTGPIGSRVECVLEKALNGQSIVVQLLRDRVNPQRQNDIYDSYGEAPFPAGGPLSVPPPITPSANLDLSSYTPMPPLPSPSFTPPHAPRFLRNAGSPIRNLQHEVSPVALNEYGEYQGYDIGRTPLRHHSPPPALPPPAAVNRDSVGLSFSSQNGRLEITDVRQGSASERAGLIVSDICLCVNGKFIPHSSTTDEVYEMITAASRGGPFQLTIFRNSISQEMVVSVDPIPATVLHTAPHSPPRPQHSPPPLTPAEEKFGVGLFLQRDGRGSHAVLSILSGSSAEQDGNIKTGDVLCSVDGINVINMSLPQIASLLLGARWSFVHLKFKRRYDNGMKKYFQVALKRTSSSESRNSPNLKRRTPLQTSAPSTARRPPLSTQRKLFETQTAPAPPPPVFPGGPAVQSQRNISEFSFHPPSPWIGKSSQNNSPDLRRDDPPPRPHHSPPRLRRESQDTVEMGYYKPPPPPHPPPPVRPESTSSVGVTLTQSVADDGLVRTVVSGILPGGPAVNRIFVGDILLSIDGNVCRSENLAQISSRLAGPKGSYVVVNVLHTNGSSEALTLQRSDSGQNVHL